MSAASDHAGYAHAAIRSQTDSRNLGAVTTLVGFVLFAVVGWLLRAGVRRQIASHPGQLVSYRRVGAPPSLRFGLAAATCAALRVLGGTRFELGRFCLGLLMLAAAIIAGLILPASRYNRSLRQTA